MSALMLAICVIGLASCSTVDRPNFALMTAAELSAYNAGVARGDQVHCAEVRVRPDSEEMQIACATTRLIEQAERNRRFDASRPPAPTNSGLSLGTDYIR